MKFLLCLLFCISISAQKKIIEIDTVITLKGATKNQLYERAKNYLTLDLNNNNQSEYFFKEDDKERGVIKIESTFINKTKMFRGSAVTGVKVKYDYEVYFKEEKIRFIVKNIYHPYFGEAIYELPYPKSKNIKMSKKWYGKAYTEYINNTLSFREKIKGNLIGSILIKDKLEEDW